jgi:hypothetical protein
LSSSNRVLVSLALRPATYAARSSTWIWSCSVGPQEVQGQAALHDDKCRLGAVAAQYDLHRLLVWLVRVFGHDPEPSRGIAFLDAADAFPPAGTDASVELATGSQFALDLSVPAGEALAIGESRPQFVDPRLEMFFDPDNARAVGRS